jgi:hypothetical protein
MRKGTMDGKPRRWLPLAQSMCAVVLAAGCAPAPAGQPETVGAVNDAVTAWLVALAAGDGERACPLMTEAARAQLTSHQGTPDCAAAVRSLSAALGPLGNDQLRRVTAGPVTVNGSEAKAAVSGGTLTLRLRDGRWLIDDLAATLRVGTGGAFPPPTGFVPSPPPTTR